MRQVAVIGPGRATPGQEDQARRLGAQLAAMGLVVVTGGLGGVMAAASRGAYESGGLTVGLLPGADPSAANPWVRVVVPTGLGEARNVLVVRAAAVVVAVGGGWGTLSEVALALRAGIGVVSLGSWAPAAGPEMDAAAGPALGPAPGPPPGPALGPARGPAAGGDRVAPGTVLQVSGVAEAVDAVRALLGGDPIPEGSRPPGAPGGPHRETR